MQQKPSTVPGVKKTNSKLGWRFQGDLQADAVRQNTHRVFPSVAERNPSLPVTGRIPDLGRKMAEEVTLGAQSRVGKDVYFEFRRRLAIGIRDLEAEILVVAETIGSRFDLSKPFTFLP